MTKRTVFIVLVGGLLYMTLPAHSQQTTPTLTVRQAAVTSGPQSTIVLSLKTASGTPGATNDTLNAAVFTASDSVSAYYAENSYGLISLSGTVTGPYTISLGSTCDRRAWASAADAAATAAGVNLSAYAHKVYIEPPETAALCGSEGLGNRNQVWIRGDHCDSRLDISHEIGHNLGLQHAASPTQDNYGDGSTIMGLAPVINPAIPANWHDMPQFNAPEKIQLGWVPTNRVQTVTAAGNYRVALLETASTDVQALKIRGALEGNDYYYFSYRRPVGFDRTLLSWYTDNTSVHKWGGGRSFIQANIADGQSFTDGPLTVTQTSHDAKYAYLLVSFR